MQRNVPQYKKNGVKVAALSFQGEDGIRDLTVTGVQTCALPIWSDIHGVRIVRAIAVTVMLSVRGRPPDDRALKTHRPQSCQDDFDRPVRRVGTMCKQTVIAELDARHRQGMHQYQHKYFDP